MLASKTSDVINADNSSSPTLGCSSSVPCSICFDLVIDDGERSIAKLQCGHRFHLDCIGSAFNTKGTMQCPNCRKVETGRWLFAEGSSVHAISDTGTQDWMPNIGPHDLSFYRRPFGFHWCPFNGFTLHSSFEEAESSLNTSSNFHGNYARPAHSYISYFRPSDRFGNSNFHHPLNSLPAPHSNNIHNPSWGWTCHFLPYNADRDYINHSRAQADALARTLSFRHPLHYTQQPVARTGESSAASSQSRERTQILHMSYQEHPSEIATNGFGRFGNVRGLPMIRPPVLGRPHHRGGHAHGFYIHDTERDEFPMIQGSFHHRLSTNRTH